MMKKWYCNPNVALTAKTIVGLPSFNKNNACDVSKLVRFRHRIAIKGMEKISSVFVKRHGQHAKKISCQYNSLRKIHYLPN